MPFEAYLKYQPNIQMGKPLPQSFLL